MIEPFSPSFYRQLQQLKIHTRRSFLGTRQGTHRSIRRGQGMEFADYRLYTPGDDFRHIDWNVYGRSDRLYMREFREEQDLAVSVILDASASMAYPEGEGKFELAQRLALALGYVALTDGDSVTYCILGQFDTQRFVGPRMLGKVREQLSEIQPSGSPDTIDEVRRFLSRQRMSGKCFFISDFLLPIEQLMPAFDLIRARNFELSLIQVLAPSEAELKLSDAHLVDSETGEELQLVVDEHTKEAYQELLKQHIGELEDYCYSGSIAHFLTTSNSSVEDIVLKELPEQGILR